MRRSQRHALLKLIAEEILAGRDPMGIREDHGINYHTWARWVRTVRQNPEVLLETPTPETATKKSVEAPKLPLPGALAASRVANRALASTRPEPATVASPSPTEPIDVMAQAHRMLKVCDELDRAGRDEGGQIRIEGGPTVNDALKRRRETIEMLARIREDWWSVSRLEEVHRVMIARIAQAERSVARDIAAGLREIDRAYGLTSGCVG